MEPLTPNTAAFLSFLNNPDEFAASSSAFTSNNLPFMSMPTSNPTSLPPSAFFTAPNPVPTLATPDQTPPSADRSPVERKPVVVSSGSESEGEDVSPAKRKGSDNHKRKAGVSRTAVEEASDSEAVGHEDKRQHQASRKQSVSEEGLSKKDKAARRKEQNRAAQKAFRERRENKVKDLEDKVAELQAKQVGASVENENLRALLKRLQEENVSLKQSAFTFTMPVTQTKPPTPPHSQSDEILRTIYDVQDSPQSIPSASSTKSSINLFNSPPVPDNSSNYSRSDSGITPPSVVSDNKSEIDALWASFYPDGINQPTMTQNNPQHLQRQFLPQRQPAPQPQPLQQPQATFTHPNTFNTAMPSTVSAFRSTPNMAYREAPFVFNPEPIIADTSNEFDWSSLGNVDDFLASLAQDTGNNKAEELQPIDDDTFNAQLASILAGSGNAFSPSNYLNMSPTPIHHSSDSASPQSLLRSVGTSPESSAGSSSSSGVQAVSPRVVGANGVGTVPPASQAAHAAGAYSNPNCPLNPASKGDRVVNVVDENGNIIKPSDLWVKMGMQHQGVVDNVMIDDLCDEMKAKATCTDGAPSITVEHFHKVMRWNKI